MIKVFFLSGVIFLIAFSPASNGIHKAYADEPTDADSALGTEDSEGWGRDPFSANEEKKSAEGGSEQGQLALTGIMIRSDRRVALVNHQFVHEGDTLSGSKVLRIEKDRIVLDRNGEEETLKLGL